MNYEEALKFIHSTYRFGSKLGLENIKDLLRRLGNPHERFGVVHVAGTNGKGSVTSMLTHVLHEAGYRVGMFISPYLERFTERIQVGLKEIEPDALARITERVKEKVEGMVGEGKNHPTEFEIVTAIGFAYFAEMKVDYAVVEVGLGGRLDATNVVDPLVSVITSISYDHMDVLGDTLEKIAAEKAGIIKQGRPVVTYPQHPEAMAVIQRVAQERGAPLFEVNKDGIEVITSEVGRQVFNYSFDEERFPGVVIHLTGRHQILNAATALTAVAVLRRQGVAISDDAVYKGMERAFWPGRLEVLRRQPFVVLDGAHNESGAEVLAQAIKEYFVGKPVTLVIGILRDKDVDAIVKRLCPLADSVIVTRADSPRTMDPAELAVRAGRYCQDVVVEPDIEKAIAMGFSKVHPDGVLLFTGSLYLIGKVRGLLRSS
ncbi:dihydrofolate synthase/folylpolyglutamate synthase [Caldicoprobacter guelmensis]|uniref:bifunctional folylpolyglutamate synthase/dihydrofolate synthase n=1 Tax=Caldicoprobacter guelmensis TaxID=1170224 RepID=UPI00195B4888|nr:folylpolyglutamate synthase/dihydrofolate synthase family protein [Caldicoprobacter guelmensis]MBM7583223.1 dihydrofolate synthase/folylpolyglutamate synthase [Caldicoprobacter guelmensis]